MMLTRNVLSACVLTALTMIAPAANAQQTPGMPPQATDAPVETPAPPSRWEGLPFGNLAEFEQLIPVGMRRRDVVRQLGDPETVMPGRGADRVVHYNYPLNDGGAVRAVIILRDDAVFIRRLYMQSPEGAPTRAQ